MSMCDGPPYINRKMHRLALGITGGASSASGLPTSGRKLWVPACKWRPKKPSPSSSEAKARPVKPAPAWKRKWRREEGSAELGTRSAELGRLLFEIGDVIDVFS